VQSARLRPDSAARLLAPGMATRAGADGKQIVDSLPDCAAATEFRPLVALYVLVPVPSAAGAPPVRRTELRPTQGAVELVRHAKIGSLLGGREARAVFERAAHVARSVPIFSLEITRDLDRLPEVAEAVGAWHGDPAATGV